MKEDQMIDQLLGEYYSERRDKYIKDLSKDVGIRAYFQTELKSEVSGSMTYFIATLDRVEPVRFDGPVWSEEEFTEWAYSFMPVVINTLKIYINQEFNDFSVNCFTPRELLKLREKLIKKYPEMIRERNLDLLDNYLKEIIHLRKSVLALKPYFQNVISNQTITWKNPPLKKLIPRGDSIKETRIEGQVNHTLIHQSGDCSEKTGRSILERLDLNKLKFELLAHTRNLSTIQGFELHDPEVLTVLQSMVETSDITGVYEVYHVIRNKRWTLT